METDQNDHLPTESESLIHMATIVHETYALMRPFIERTHPSMATQPQNEASMEIDRTVGADA